MTSPTLVGSVAVEVSASAKGFAQRLRAAVVKEFKDAGLDKALAEAIGKKPIKVPLQPEWDEKQLPKSLPVPRQRAPRREPAPDTDALLKAFREDVQRQIRALSRQAIKIPVQPDGDSLRDGIGEQIKEVQRRLKVQVPTEPGERREYERSLRGMLDDIAGKVRMSLPAPEVKPPTKPVTVPVKVDPLTKAFQAEVQREISALSRLANAKIPVTADTAPLRARAAAAVAEVERALKAEIPTEPEGRAAYEAKLRAMVASASRRVHASIPVDVDYNRFQRAVAGLAAQLPQGLGDALRRIGDSANTAGSAVMSAMGGAATALTSLVNPATLAAVAIGGTVAAFFAIGPAVSVASGAIGVLGGALGSLPALAAGGAAVFGTFGLALKGVADRFKDTASSAVSAGASTAAQGRQVAAAQRAIEQASRGVASAERSLANAQREAARSQKAINDARKAARERIEDLGRALRGAVLDEKDAQLRILEAEQDLADARKEGDPLAIKRAELALEQAKLAAENAADAAQDLAEQKADADKKGVEGSDEVAAALDRQRAAQEQVLAAQDALKSAQDGLIAANDQLAAANERVDSSATKAAEAMQDMVKLAPSALAFVAAVKALKQPFEDLRLTVQDRFFQGLDQTVAKVGQAWIPQLKTTLGRYADTFNGFFKTLGTNLSQPRIIADIAAGMESMRAAGERVGQAVSGPLLNAFSRLSRAAGPFIDAFGDELGRLVEDFATWIRSADESGKLDAFFEKASGFLRDVFAVGKSVASIFVSLTKVLFGANEGAGGSGLVDALDGLAKFLANPENQRKLTAYIGAFVVVGKTLLTVTGWAFKLGFAITTSASAVASAGDRITGTFTKIRDIVVAFVEAVGRRLAELPGQITNWLGSLPDKVNAIFADLTTKAGNTVGYGLGVVARFFVELPGKIGTAIQGLPGKVTTIATSAVNKARDILSTLPGKGASAVSGLGDRIKAVLSGLPGRLYNIGRDLVVGLWDGITSLGNWLRDRVVGFASSVITGFQHGFDSHSPSRKMIAVGVTLPQGLAVGMERDLSKVAAARDALVSAATPDITATYAARISTAGLDMPPATAVTPAAALPPVEVRFTGSAPDSFIAWLRNNVRISYGGSAQAAIGTGGV